MESRVAKRVTSNLRRYAVVGAEQRLLELATEAAEIFAMFPELRGPGRGFMARAKAEPDAPKAPKKRRGRRKLSADARKRMSEAQKARWAKRKAKGGSGTK
jgi:hypothetical protein